MTRAGDQREAELLSLLDGIADPCSRALGKPVGLVSLGIVDGIDLTGDEAVVAILPTMPGCLFIGVIEEQVERLAGSLPWCSAVKVRVVDGFWEPSRVNHLSA